MPRQPISSLLTLKNVEQLLECGGIRADRVEIAHDGNLTPRHEFSRGRDGSAPVDIHHVYERFQQGDTLVFNHLSQAWPPLRDLCRRLTFETDVYVWANAYLTPGNSQGFSLHHDTHSVFIVQTSGSKMWRLYEPAFADPLEGQSYNAVVPKADRDRIAESKPALEVTLHPGDVLWVPRGWVHSGRSTDTHSLHVTLGFNPYTPLRVLEKLLEQMKDVAELRRELRWGIFDSPAEFGRVATSAMADFSAAAAAVDWARLAEEMLLTDERPAWERNTGQLGAFDAPFTPDTEVVTVRSALRELAEVTDGGLAVRTARKTLSIRQPSSSVLLSFLDREEDEPWRASDLAPSVGPTAATNLVELLARNGVVRRCDI
jgi:ribosomal protein L16 Arg81 hydroxylase